MGKLKKELYVFEKLDQLLKDTDDEELKKRVKQFQKECTDVFKFAVTGAKGCGKTTFINNIFLKSPEEALPKADIVEYRYGACKNALSLKPGFIRQFLTAQSLEGMAVLEVADDEAEKKALWNEKLDGLFVLLEADDIQNPSAWNIIENKVSSRVICVLTKGDTLGSAQLKTAKEKVRQYLNEAGVLTPVFVVSAFDENEGIIDGGFGEIDEYIRNTITSQHPLTEKRERNMEQARAVVRELQNSFLKRKEQFESDRKTLAEIDKRMDSLRLQQKGQIEELRDQVKDIVGEQVDEYRDTLIQALDPAKIKRNFVDKHSCMEWMKDKAELCEKQLNNKVNAEVVQLFRLYFRRITEIYEESIALLENRKLLLDAEDHFYGTLAESKRSVDKRSSEVMKTNKEQYTLLLNESEQYMEAMWRESEKFDKNTKDLEHLAAGGGFLTVGGGSAALILSNVAISTKVVLGAVSGSALIGIVAAIALYEITKPMIESAFSEKREKSARENTEQFKKRIEDIKNDMIINFQKKTEELFSAEVDHMDKAFLEFRMSVNIDARNIPQMEQSMEELLEFLENG